MQGSRRVLFDGVSLAHWKTGVYGDDAELEVVSGGVVIPIGVPISGITYDGIVPVPPYELQVEATRLNGSDFFLGITFPVKESHATLVLGGWGGALSGLSCLDGEDASNNDTRCYEEFPNGKRQTVLVQVSDERVRAMVNGNVIVDAAIGGRRVSIRPEVQPSLPLGIASFATSTLLHRVEVLEGTE